VIAFGVLIVSALLTFAQVDLMDMYRLMGYPERQIEQMQRYSFFTNRNCFLFMSISSLRWLGFLLYAKKYFRRTA